MKRSLKIATLLFILPLLSWGQTTIWSEDFSGQGGKGALGSGSGPTFDTTGVSWSIDVSGSALTATTDYFQVVSGAFEGQDLDGDAIWYSPSINTSGCSNIQFSLDATEIGDHESTDYFDVYYSLNGGAYTLVQNWNGKGNASHTLIGDIPNDNDWGSETVSVTGLTCTSLQLKVVMKNNSGSEVMQLDNVLVEGTCSCSPDTEPTTNASSLAFSNIFCTSMQLDWTNGNGANRIVVASTSPISGTPADQTNYTAAASFGSGSTIAANEYVVYNGSGSSVVVNNLSAGTTYYFSVFEYNGSTPDCDENYLTSGTILTGSQTTASSCTCPQIRSTLVNACTGNEGTDEYIVFDNGSSDIYVDDISITFHSAGTYCNTSCGSQTLLNNQSYINDLNALAGCNLFTYSDTIPAGARVIVFTGNPPSYTFDFSSQCGSGPFYAIFTNNTSTTGRFANSANGTRDLSIDFSPTCSDTVSYYSSSGNTGTDGDYVEYDNAGNPTYKNEGNCIFPLPIELLSFSGTYIDGWVHLNWTTASEINNDFFTIEKSEKGKEYTPLKVVHGAGNSSENNSYFINDYHPFGKVTYYRLKQTDFDGKYSYSQIIPVKIPETGEFLKIFSVTSQGENIEVFFSSETGKAHVKVIDLRGRTVFEKRALQGGKISFSKSKLQRGIYILHLNNTYDKISKKIMVR